MKKMVKNICLIGCGEIGSRHLQALGKLSLDTRIHIVEPNIESKNIAISRLDQVLLDKNQDRFLWYNSINELQSCDLAIVATLATGRHEQIIQLLEKGITRFVVEKMVCQSTSEYDLILSGMKKFNAKIWINAVRRYFPLYQYIKKTISKNKPVSISVVTGNKGLGTNAIHYLDLLSWFTGDTNIHLNGEFLHNSLFPNKRGKNLIEFRGTILGELKNGSTIAVTSIPTVDIPTNVQISNDDDFFIFDEYGRNLFLKNSVVQDTNYNYEHVSSTTTKIVDDILKKDDCYLPNIEQMYETHSELFRIFNKLVEHCRSEVMISASSKTETLCPIT